MIIDAEKNYKAVLTFLLSLCLSPSLLPSVFPISYYSNSSFSILLLPFPFSHSTGDNPQIEGIPVYWQKAKKKVNSGRMLSSCISVPLSTYVAV